MEITIKEIKNKFESLPEDLKWAIVEANVDENILSIGKRIGLTIDKIGQLALETYAVLLGYTHPDKFLDSIQKSLGEPSDKVKRIGGEVNEVIIKKIRDKVVKLYTKQEENPYKPERKPTNNEKEKSNKSLPIDKLKSKVHHKNIYSTHTEPVKKITKIDPYREPVE